MFFVYIIQSQKNGRFYVGYSDNPDRRLLEHNSGKVTSTRLLRPWKKVYTESYCTQLEAMRRELEIKARKSRKYLEWLLLKSNGIEQTRPDCNRDG
jgi:putative endonuclease